MGKFLNDLILKDTCKNEHGREIFELHEPLSYEIGDNGSNIVITAIQGFRSDYGSIPRIFWRLLPPIGEYGRATIIHDMLCSSKNFPRIIADAIFYDCMVSVGVPVWKRVFIYAGIKTYWICWGKWFGYKINRPYIYKNIPINNQPQPRKLTPAQLYAMETPDE